VARRRKPRPRSRHGGGEGWDWTFPWPRPPLPPPAKASRPSALDKAITRIVTWFRVGGKRYRTTERKRGRRTVARVHPHRYRRREYPRR